MIVHASAILAIVFREPGLQDLVERLRSADFVGAGTPTLAEKGIVLHARHGEARRPSAPLPGRRLLEDGRGGSLRGEGAGCSGCIPQGLSLLPGAG
jgi:uncharacterized protein with PIN domain